MLKNGPDARGRRAVEARHLQGTYYLSPLLGTLGYLE